MNTYTSDAQQVIKEHFEHIRVWISETTAWSTEPHYLNTCNHYFLVWLNSINETLFEDLIRTFYKKYLKYCYSSNDHLLHYELSKIEKIIDSNHKGSYDGFLEMLEKIIWWTKINDIKNGFKLDLTTGDQGFISRVNKINNKRNKIGHDARMFF